MIKRILWLKRVSSKEKGTFGVLIDEYPFALTCEPPKGRCMPKGRYRCVPYTRPTGVKTFEILVPGHTKVLFHSGNTIQDTALCVVVAEQFHDIRTPKGTLPGVLYKAGFAELMQRFGSEKEFELRIS